MTELAQNWFEHLLERVTSAQIIVPKRTDINKFHVQVNSKSNE